MHFAENTTKIGATMTTTPTKPQALSDIRLVKLPQFKPAPWNPPNRVAKAAIRYIKDSLEWMGQASPVIITKGKLLVDGHRRLAAATMLGWTWLEAKLLDDTVSPEEAYAQINFSSRRTSMKDMFQAFMINSYAIPLFYRDKFIRMQNAIGKQLMREMLEAGLSFTSFLTAVKAAEVSSLDVKDIIRWLIVTNGKSQLKIMLEEEISSAALRKIIVSGKLAEIRFDAN